MHIHGLEDETFQISEGEYEWTVGDKKRGDCFAPREITRTHRYLGQASGRLVCIITSSGFEGLFEEIGALTPEHEQNIPMVMEIAKKFGLEFLPTPGRRRVNAWE